MPGAVSFVEACVLTFQLLCTSIDPCLCGEILDVCAKLCLTSLLHFPPPQITSTDPQLHQAFVLGSFAGLLTDPDRSHDTAVCMDSMKKLAKKTLCAAELFPGGGLLGFSSYLLNQLLFWLTCWPLEGLCCESKLSWWYCRDTNPCPVVASIPASSWLLPDLICWLSSSVPCLTLLFIQFLFPPPSLIQLRFFILPSVLLLPKPTHLFHFSIPSCF